MASLDHNIGIQALATSPVVYSSKLIEYESQLSGIISHVRTGQNYEDYMRTVVVLSGTVARIALRIYPNEPEIIRHASRLDELKAEIESYTRPQ